MILKLILSIVLIAAGGIFIIKEDYLSKSSPEPIPATKILEYSEDEGTAPPTFGQTEEECTSAPDVITQVFADKDYDRLTYCLVENVNFSVFGSSYLVTLNKNELIQEIKLVTEEASDWITNQDDPEIIYTKESHPEWINSFIVLGDHDEALVFIFNQHQKIEAVVKTFRYYPTDQ